MSSDQFKKAEEEYFRLRGQLSAGRITREQFERALHDLIVQDAEGRHWMLGVDTAKWYVHQGQDWVEAQPPGMSPSAAIPPARPPEAKARTPSWAIFAVGGLGLVCLCGMVALLLASSTGILKLSLGAFGEPTSTRFPTITPFIAPTQIPLPTITPLPTSTPTQSPTPTLTPTPTPTPTATTLLYANCADPNAQWENVVDGQTIEPLQAFTGTATAANFTGYVIEWLRPGNVLYKSTTPVVHGVLFTWNTLTVENGEYPVALIVVLNDGTNLAPCVIRVRVAH